MAELTQREREAQAALKIFEDTNQETHDTAFEKIAAKSPNTADWVRRSI